MVEREQRDRAEAELVRATQRLHALRRQALLGDYDGDEFDRAVAEYRVAARAVVEARTGATVHENAPPISTTPGSARLGLQVPPAFLRAFLAEVEVAAAPAAPPVSPVPSEPFVPSPRMQFVKWLVATGRLSDHDTTVPGRRNEP